jgi:hypothetical protein
MFIDITPLFPFWQFTWVYTLQKIIGNMGNDIWVYCSFVFLVLNCSFLLNARSSVDRDSALNLYRVAVRVITVRIELPTLLVRSMLVSISYGLLIIAAIRASEIFLA